MKPQYCKVHPHVQRVVLESTSINGGHIDWGCAICNLLARDAIEKERDALKRALEGCRPYVILQEQADIIDEALGDIPSPPPGSLVRKPSAHAPPGCYCTERCMAPTIQGQQTPCRDPTKAATFAHQTTHDVTGG